MATNSIYAILAFIILMCLCFVERVSYQLHSTAHNIHY